MLLPPEAPVGLWPSMFAVQGAGADTEPHRHHGIHLVLARSTQLEVTVDGTTHPTAGVLTPPDLDHAIAADGVVLICFIDPECEAGGRLTTLLAAAPRFFDGAERDALLDGLPAEPSGSDLSDWVDRTLLALDITAGARRTVHPKVRKLLRLLSTAPLEPAPVLEEFADRIGLSAPRLMHVFAESTGTTWRAYLRWLRFQRATAAMIGGASLTDAAMEAGFHDSSHMTRTFKATYGLTPSKLLGRRVPSRE